MQWGCGTKSCHASDLKESRAGMRESAWAGDGKRRLRCLLLLWQNMAKVLPEATRDNESVAPRADAAESGLAGGLGPAQML